MALIDDVKPRIGIYYSDFAKDVEVQGIIDGAISYYSGAGWIIDPLSYTPTAVEAIVLYCKMAMSSDPALMTNHPVLIAFIAQNRT